MMNVLWRKPSTPTERDCRLEAAIERAQSIVDSAKLTAALIEEVRLAYERSERRIAGHRKGGTY